MTILRFLLCLVRIPNPLILLAPEHLVGVFESVLTDSPRVPSVVHLDDFAVSPRSPVHVADKIYLLTLPRLLLEIYTNYC